jgi:hypothetical protein
MYLAKSEELQDLLDLGGDADDTANTDHEDDLLLGGNEDLTVGLGSATVNDGIVGDLAL